MWEMQKTEYKFAKQTYEENITGDTYMGLMGTYTCNKTQTINANNKTQTIKRKQ